MSVCRVHPQHQRGEAIQSLQERLPHGDQRVSAQVLVPAGRSGAAHLWKQGRESHLRESTFGLVFFLQRYLLLAFANCDSPDFLES